MIPNDYIIKLNKNFKFREKNIQLRILCPKRDFDKHYMRFIIYISNFHF